MIISYFRNFSLATHSTLTALIDITDNWYSMLASTMV